ncbi:pantoate--beta-alanine ligase [bacterium]|nr:pantoate--beta-alanine ligase [bacterium]
MKIIRTVGEMQGASEQDRMQGLRIGFVPTMGFLHEGHLSLVRIARSLSDRVVLSIYVNPTQFSPGEDLSRYPRDFERDEALAADAGVDAIFHPSDSEMYPEGFRTSVRVREITEHLCGSSRPGHFEGVATVCLKLFHAVKPHVAVFGQKDAQQAAVIRRMVKDLDLDLEIVTGPIVREPDGLAMSSRNAYLSPVERKQAAVLHESLKTAEGLIRKGEMSAEVIKGRIQDMIAGKSSARIDYVEVVDAESFKPVSRLDSPAVIALAVFFGKTRLIDNMLWRPVTGTSR